MPRASAAPSFAMTRPGRAGSITGALAAVCTRIALGTSAAGAAAREPALLGVDARELGAEQEDLRRVVNHTITTTSEPAAPNADATLDLRGTGRSPTCRLRRAPR